MENDDVFPKEDEASVRSILEMMAGDEPGGLASVRDLLISSLEQGRELPALAGDARRFAARLHAIKGTAGLGGLSRMAAVVAAAEPLVGGLSTEQRFELGAKLVAALETVFQRLRSLAL